MAGKIAEIRIARCVCDGREAHAASWPAAAVNPFGTTAAQLLMPENIAWQYGHDAYVGNGVAGPRDACAIPPKNLA